MGESGMTFASYSGGTTGGTAPTPSAGTESTGMGGYIGVFGSVVSGIASIYSNYIQGQMAASAFTFNSKLKEIQARMITHTAKINADRQRKAATPFVARQKAKYMKAGVKSEGSPIDVMIDSQANFEYDARMTEVNAMMGAGNKQLEAANYVTKAEFEESQGIQKATQSLLTTTYDVAERYYNPKGK